MSFSGEYRRPFRDLWSAWKIASIFARTDILVPQKIQYYKNGAVVLDAAALREILKLASNEFTNWTEFLCATKRIVAHPAIEENSVTEFHRMTFEKLKQDLREEAQTARKVKGPRPEWICGPETAWLLEKDGPAETRHKGGNNVCWASRCTSKSEDYETWIIVWPVENMAQEHKRNSGFAQESPRRGWTSRNRVATNYRAKGDKMKDDEATLGDNRWHFPRFWC